MIFPEESRADGRADRSVILEADPALAVDHAEGSGAVTAETVHAEGSGAAKTVKCSLPPVATVEQTVKCRFVRMAAGRFCAATALRKTMPAETAAAAALIVHAKALALINAHRLLVRPATMVN